jgi:Protein of Unknown function (DUF2784)
VVHLLFVLWVLGGVLPVRFYPELQWAHIALLAYSAFVEVVPRPRCPLTLPEQMLESRAGPAVYHGAFLLHCLATLVYPNLPTTCPLVGVTVAFCAGTPFYYFFARRNRKVMRGHPAQ